MKFHFKHLQYTLICGSSVVYVCPLIINTDINLILGQVNVFFWAIKNGVKGFEVLNLATNKLFDSWDVVFCEDHFPFIQQSVPIFSNHFPIVAKFVHFDDISLQSSPGDILV